MEAWYEHSSGLCHNTFFFGKFSHQVIKICSTNNCNSENRQNCWKVLFQNFRNFKIRLNVTKESATKKLLHQTFFTQRTLKGKDFSEMIFERLISFERAPPLTFWQFYKRTLFLLNVMFAHLVLTIFYTPVSISASLRELLLLDKDRSDNNIA